jgi:hypothetical protein
VVVMGHTHLARQIKFSTGGTYINTGTWADILRIPFAALDKSGVTANAALETFLLDLKQDRRRNPVLNYADLHIEPDGHVSHAELAPAF